MTAVVLGRVSDTLSRTTPFFVSPPAAAGFPSPAENELETALSLDEYLISRPTSTFLIRLCGLSMETTIPDGSILVVDRSAEARSGRIVVVSLDNEFLVKELVKPRNRQPYLRSHNRDYPDIVIDESVESILWGVVVGFAKKL